jgi:single-strand DNA-binding protein
VVVTGGRRRSTTGGSTQVHKLTITVWGNVATEPMHVVSPSGKPRTTFRLASTPRSKREDGSYGDGTTSFFNVTCFGYVAVNVAASVHKGDPVVLFGDLTVREWQADGGRAGKDVDLVAQHIGPNLRWGRATFERPPRPARAGDVPRDDRGPDGDGPSSVPGTFDGGAASASVGEAA